MLHDYDLPPPPLHARIWSPSYLPPLRYNIPSKMLYDPAPLNDPGDPGWDMSPYANYSGGAQSYTYRRRRALGLADDDDAGEGRAESLARGMPAPNLNGEPPRFSVEQVLDHRRRASLLSSAAARDWRERMVFYTGDERNFYQGLDGTTCSPDEAAFDPSCRTPRKTHRPGLGLGNREPNPNARPNPNPNPNPNPTHNPNPNPKQGGGLRGHRRVP